MKSMSLKDIYFHIANKEESKVVYVGQIKDEKSLEKYTDDVLNQLKETIKDLDYKTAQILLYWLDTWGRKYLSNEKSFNYDDLIQYKRGMVVQANLGFKVGSEQGGLHYALIIENYNFKTNKTVMVIPLRSLDEDESSDKIKDNELFLGYGIFKEEIEKIQRKIAKNRAKLEELNNEKEDVSGLISVIKRQKRKLKNFKKGSVALLNQMCALSKMRIYTPKKTNGELYSFRLDNEKLDEIDKKIMQLYLNPKLLKNNQGKLTIKNK